MTNTEKILVIVESPNKVKTISNILKSSGYTSAAVTASIGHIMTLGNGGSAFNSGVSPEKNFALNLTVPSEKKKVVHEISELAKKAEKIFIMTDGDREGELIAYSIIKFCKLPVEKCFRAITREITKSAVINAIEHPVIFDENLVNAGLVRMMSDKLIGYGLSPIGKKYIGAKSIGRCQSVGLKLVSDREKEILNFIPELYFNLYLKFTKDSADLTAKYIGYKDEKIDKLSSQADTDAVINSCKNSNFIVKDISTVTRKESPKPPFCTATFQQEAATKLGLRVKDAMSCAQKLFEGMKINGEHQGLITYIRTDSTDMSEEFIPTLKTFIEKHYTSVRYVTPRKTKAKATDQSGHEALRVVNPEITPEIFASHTSNEFLVKVYKLIWQRTIASAMQNASILETTYTITNNDHKFMFITKKVLDYGYKVVYKTASDSAEQNVVLTMNETLTNTVLEPVKKFTQPKARYTEASLIKELQDREIGRPSTYTTIVETILSVSRGYAKLEDKHIVPTDRGIQLADYCDRAFPTLINLNYTKTMEESLDKIAEGKINWLDYMEIFYDSLKNVIENTSETGIATDMPEKVCPICKSTMVVRRSRFGKLFYGCSSYPQCKGIINI